MKSKKAMDSLLAMIIFLVPILIIAGFIIGFEIDIFNIANNAVDRNCKHISEGWLGKCIPPTENCKQKYGGVDYSSLVTPDTCYNKKKAETKLYTCCVLEDNPANKIQVYSVDKNGQTLIFGTKNDFNLNLDGKGEIGVSFKIVDTSKDYLVYDKIVFSISPSSESSCVKEEQIFTCTNKNCIFPVPGGSGEGTIQYKPLKLSKGLCIVQVSGYSGEIVTFSKESTLNVYDSTLPI